MIFSKDTILKYISDGLISIVPLDESHFKDASYTLTIDTGQADSLEIKPGSFIVAKTLEHMKLSPSVACFVSTRGSVAQRGVDIAQSSIFCEPDTDNVITLEISNHSLESVVLRRGDKVAKAIFVQVTNEPYAS